MDCRATCGWLAMTGWYRRLAIAGLYRLLKRSIGCPSDRNPSVNMRVCNPPQLDHAELAAIVIKGRY